MRTPPTFDDGRPSFDHTLAASLIGKHVLVGVTCRGANGNILAREQFHGEVTVADSEKGFCLKLRGTRVGEMKWLPPNTRAFLKAKPGEYRLRSTGEVIINPDFTATWTVTEPQKGMA
ncbi:MAG: hypothetical protein MRJ68_16925 [Nitrospira sp.]|nr:hypothetical protein [Nitrospira sp.]